MEVILLREVPKVGGAGAVVKVRDGFARNYLFPRKLGVPSTEAHKKRIETRQRLEQHKVQQVKEQALALAKKISGMSCTVKMPAGENDKLYGSVTHQQIQEALNQLGIHIDKRDVLIDEPIRKLGQAMVKVRLHPGVDAALKVWVVKQ